MLFAEENSTWTPKESEEFWQKVWGGRILLCTFSWLRSAPFENSHKANIDLNGSVSKTTPIAFGSPALKILSLRNNCFYFCCYFVPYSLKRKSCLLTFPLVWVKSVFYNLVCLFVYLWFVKSGKSNAFKRLHPGKGKETLC